MGQMRINVKFDSKVLKSRTLRQAKRLAFNTAQALNETVKEIQVAERINLEKKFTLRRSTFMHRLIKIFHFASAKQGRAFAEIGIDKKKRVLLSQFERGGVKEPAKGATVAVPITGQAARPRFAEPVPQQFQFRQLRLRKAKGKGGPRFRGKLGTFIIPGVGVFQRVAQGAKQKISIIYAFVRRPKLDPVLRFGLVAAKTFAKVWPREFNKAFRRLE